MRDMDATVDFHGATVRLEDEYLTARKMMGTKGTDLDQLHSTVTHLYLNIEDDGWAVQYRALMQEIEYRSRMLTMLELGLS
jgi:hypothetical protein